MITIFICTDRDLAKEITTEYLGKNKVPYVNMLEHVEYDAAVEAIEALENRPIIHIEQHKTYLVKLRLRDSYKKRGLKTGMKDRDGEIVAVRAGYLNEVEDKYPGEMAMIPLSSFQFLKEGVTWIASGDVELIQEL